MSITRETQKNEKDPASENAPDKEALRLKDSATDKKHLLDMLFQAQELVWEAENFKYKRDRVAYAQEALELSDMCADAYMLLGEETRGVLKRRHYYERAVAAAKRAVEVEFGPDAFTREDVPFWKDVGTRPYMRALYGLSFYMWDTGERQEAVAILKDLLRLNPDDNQGNRIVLITRLLGIGDLSSAENILKTYPEPYLTDWAWNNTLLLFLTEGPSTEAYAALENACERNRFVADMLTGVRQTPRTAPSYCAMGSHEEAASYVIFNKENWAAAKRVLLWVAEKTEGK